MMRSAGENYPISANFSFYFNIFISCKHINAKNMQVYAVKSLFIIAHSTFQMIRVLDSKE